VPHSAQNSRVTARSKSFRENCFGAPFVYLKPGIGIAMKTFGEPPVMYWHSRQWHCAIIIGSPSAS
jgi:hypothetical protein